MRIQFDANQTYQLDAVTAVVDAFAGQPLAQGESEIALTDPDGLQLTELGIANRLAVAPQRVARNVAKVQERTMPGQAPGAAEEMVFTVEMETGTGKTYVYLRTIFELHAMYGWKKFIIVVPSVAIREGVLKSIELMRPHFQELYGNVPFDTWIYDSAQASRLRSFATSNTLQLLVLNIQAFDKKGINVIHLESDRMSGFKPLDFVQSARPIVVLDEPQNMTSDKRKEAVASLRPLFELRYSATHREIVNLLYKLDPVKAYDLGLVKRIEVSSVTEEADFTRPYLSLKGVNSKPYHALLEVDVDDGKSTKRKPVKIAKADTDLHELTKRDQYQGYIVTEIDAEEQSITFSNGLRLVKGESHGADRDQVMRVQIRETIERHLKKERKLASLPPPERMKVLSLFFIDRVANYATVDGKIRRWFEEEYSKLAPQYPDLGLPDVARAHDGYFARDKEGPKDTSGASKADDDAYELIMRDKERLLSPAEPLRFIFSHSALREGWDNPNVFQICTLNETRSETKKRQEIGRGLRLPVRADGTRCFDRSLNLLTVVANESYEQFARGLQAEIREECGVDFGDRVRNARTRKEMKLREGWNLDPAFQQLWERIRPRTRYNVRFKSVDLVARASLRLKESAAIVSPKIAIRRGELKTTESGVVHETKAVSSAMSGVANVVVPDLLGHLQRTTQLTRSALVQILLDSGRLGDAYVNPHQLIEQAQASIDGTLNEMLVEGIEYEQLDDQVYDQRLLMEAGAEPYEDRLVEVERSIYEQMEVDSKNERRFALDLDQREDVQLFFKLPSKFTIDTPIGTYNPDWAIVLKNGQWVFLVRETKAALKPEELRGKEHLKIKCGNRHFECLGVDFCIATSADEIRLPHGDA